MSELPQSPRARGAQLGAELRRLRRLAGKSGREIARSTGMSQTLVSRIERGATIPSLPQVSAWADAIDAADDARAYLAALAESALNEVESFRNAPADGVAPLQEDVRQQEASTRALLNFQSSHVPGLLQTEDYARSVMRVVLAEPPADLDTAVAVRMARQSVLAEPGKRFEFLMTEAAVRWVPADTEPGMLAAQLSRIIGLAELPNISVGVIPSGAPMWALTRCPFVLYDDRLPGHQPFVIIEAMHAAIYAVDPADVDKYRAEMAALRRSALMGAEAADFLRALTP
jgi:transcriptional regulator with XRE-family HTH domain